MNPEKVILLACMLTGPRVRKVIHILVILERFFCAERYKRSGDLYTMPKDYSLSEGFGCLQEDDLRNGQMAGIYYLSNKKETII